MRQPRIGHVVAGRVMHLRLLQVEARLGEAVEVADVVVMQVRQDDIGHLVGVDADELQSLDRIAQEIACAPGGDLGG